MMIFLVPLFVGVAAVAAKPDISKLMSRAVQSDTLLHPGRAVAAVLGAAHNETQCFPVFLVDGSAYFSNILEAAELQRYDSVAVFVTEWLGNQATNETRDQLSNLIYRVRQLRRKSQCVTVVVVSNDPAFLTTFAEWSLKGRLLMWSTRLLVLTTLPRDDLRDLLTGHWTFFMNNAMVINTDHYNGIPRCSVYYHLPYGPTGARVVEAATWTSAAGLTTHHGLFPEKYLDFHGSVINVTALPYEPYWKTEVVEDNNNNTTTTHSGMHYDQLVVLGQGLNFTFNVLHSQHWGEVTDQVEARKSFIAPVIYQVLPNRLERWDYTIIFDFSSLSFCMAKPILRPNWLSFYYPLSGLVWSAIILSTVIACFAIFMITKVKMNQEVQQSTIMTVVMAVVGTLLGQGVLRRVSSSESFHLLAGLWLLFGVVVSSAYRSSLIASLTLPSIPPRPETVEQLVKAVDKIFMEQYMSMQRDFFVSSNYAMYQELGSTMELGVNIVDGLSTAQQEKAAIIDQRQYMELIIAKLFTKSDGTSSLYIGRERILMSISAWPIPHDAPYKPAFDKVLLKIIESGLMEQWQKTALKRAAQDSKVEQQGTTEETRPNESEAPPETSSEARSLNMTHLLGPFLLLLFGLSLGGVIFVAEICLCPLS